MLLLLHSGRPHAHSSFKSQRIVWMCVSINQSLAYYCIVPRRPNHPLINDWLIDWLALTHSLLNQQHSFPLDFQCLLACKVRKYTLDFAHLQTAITFYCVLYSYITTSYDGHKQWSVFIQLKMLIYILTLQYNRQRRFFFIIVIIIFFFAITFSPVHTCAHIDLVPDKLLVYQ